MEDNKEVFLLYHVGILSVYLYLSSTDLHVYFFFFGYIFHYWLLYTRYLRKIGRNKL